MSRKNVLIVDDDPAYGRFLARAVRGMGMAPLVAPDLRRARAFLRAAKVHLVILDRLLSGGRDGLSFCLELKKDPRTRPIPVLILTGTLWGFPQEVKGYRYGADLYLPKTISLSKLTGYIAAFAQRLPYKREVHGEIVHKGLILNCEDRTLAVGRRVLRSLPQKQFELMRLLIAKRGGALSRRDIVEKLWKNGVRDKEVDVLVSRLRARLGKPASSLIVPVRSRGYRLNAR